jgi:hypothetical protein
MRRQNQSAGFVPMQVQPLAAPEGGGTTGITQADPTSLADRAVAAALSRPGVSGFSVTANPGAPNPGSITANPGMPAAGSALGLLGTPSTVGQLGTGAPGGAAPGMGDVFASALAAAQQRAQALMQAQPRLFGGDPNSTVDLSSIGGS